jgi:phosphoribosyl-AMP cyclohydrolase
MALMRLDPETIAAIRWNEAGLIAVVVQDANSLEVLMVAHMNETALRRTLETGDAVFWSRSRQELWRKGATSGNTQRLIELRVDCDADTLLLLVEPAGPACHTNARSCFFRSFEQFQQKPERH